MAKRVSPTKVGAFVLVALVIAGLSIAILGGSDLLNTKDRCIIFFNDSVKGLYVGSAVTFRGVEVGRVTRISLDYDPQTNASTVPVLVDLEPGRVTGLRGDTKEERLRLLRFMISRGLRAQLAPDSLLTNSEIIQLEFMPAQPAVFHANPTKYFQIPSVPSTLAQLQSELESAVQHFPALTDTLNSTVKNLNALMSPENRAHLSALLAHADTITGEVAQHKDEVGDAMANLDRSTQHLAEISDNLNQLLAEDRAPLHTLIVNLGKTSISLGRASDQLNAMLNEDRAGLRQFSNGTLYQLNGLIVDARQLVHRADNTFDSLNRNPSAFLFGNNSEGIPAK